MYLCEYRDWQDYYRYEPFGTEIEDFRASTIIASIFQAQGAGDVSWLDVYRAYFERSEDRVARERKELAEQKHAARKQAALEARLQRWFEGYEAKQEEQAD